MPRYMIQASHDPSPSGCLRMIDEFMLLGVRLPLNDYLKFIEKESFWYSRFYCPRCIRCVYNVDHMDLVLSCVIPAKVDYEASGHGFPVHCHGLDSGGLRWRRAYPYSHPYTDALPNANARGSCRHRRQHQQCH